MGLSQSQWQNAAAYFLMAFLSALCALCGKKSLPRFMADWRILSTNILYIYHSPPRIS